MKKRTNEIESIVSKDLKNLDTNIDELSKGILGYGKTIEDMLDPSTTPVDFNKFGTTMIQTSQNSILNMRGSMKGGGRYNVSDFIYGIFDNKAELVSTELRNILAERIALNNEMNWLVNNMVEISNAIDMLADDVVYPNASNKSGIIVEFNGNDETLDAEQYDNLIKFFRPLENPLHTIQQRKKFSYNIEDHAKQIIHDFAIYGFQIVATIPYRKIVQDLLYDVDSNEDKTYASAAEADTIMHNNYKEKSKPFGESLAIDNLNEIVPESVNNEIRNLISNTPYSEADLDYVDFLLSNYSEDILVENKDKSIKPINGGVVDLLTPISEAGDNTLTMATVDRIKSKQNKKFNIDSITGCTHDVLDPSRIIPIYLKDDLMGVYVVEQDTNMSMANRLGPSLANLINAGHLKDDTGGSLDAVYTQKVKRLIYDDIRKVLYQNIDKKLLKNNPNLIEDIEYVISNTAMDNANLQGTKVRFIPHEFLTLHKIGDGPLGVPLLLKARKYAHLYTQLLSSDMQNKMYLEKPRWTVKINYNGDQSSNARTAQSVRNITKVIPKLSDVGLPDMMSRNTAAFSTVMIPLNTDNSEPFSIDQLPMMEAKDNTDYLRMLRNQVTMVLGYPADIFDPSQQLDFAKKISNININTARKVLAIQNNLSLSLSELCTKRIQYLTGNEKIGVKIKFEVPNELVNTINNDVLEQRDKLSEVYGEIIDKDPRIADEFKEQVKQSVNKRLLKGLIDESMYEDAIRAVITYKEGNRSFD